MTTLVQMSTDLSGSRPIQHGDYVDTTFTPHDGATYRLVTWIVQRSQGAWRFFAIARQEAPLTGAFIPLTRDLSFVDYVELYGASRDMDLELLWAGWRSLLYLTGRDDQAPPDDLPAWRQDWHAELSVLPRASELIVREKTAGSYHC